MGKQRLLAMSEAPPILPKNDVFGKKMPKYLQDW